MSEAHTQQEIRLALSQGDSRVFRNNCGGYKDATGRFIRYGVANPGGSDLIGWKTITVTPDMVGRSIAVFMAVEVKGSKTRISPEQINFIERVREAGGIGGIARSVDDALAITQQLF